MLILSGYLFAGIGTQLSELQDQINSLDPGPSPHTQDPSKVAVLLSKKKELLFLEFDAAVRHSIRWEFSFYSTRLGDLIPSQLTLIRTPAILKILRLSTRVNAWYFISEDGRWSESIMDPKFFQQWCDSHLVFISAVVQGIEANVLLRHFVTFSLLNIVIGKEDSERTFWSSSLSQ